MQIEASSILSRFVRRMRRPLWVLAVFACVAGFIEPGTRAGAQQLPAEAYGPYNVTFLPDGPGVTKPLGPGASLDPRRRIC